MDRVLWSLKPIASWLDVLGVDLQLAQNRRPILRRYSQQFLGLIVFSCFVGLRLQIFVTNEVDYVIVRDWKGAAAARHFTQTASMARNLRHLTSALSPIFLHLSFLTAVAFRWTHLTESIDAVIHLINPDNRFYRKLRRISFAGLGCIFVELIVEIYEYYNDPGTKEMNRLLRRTIHWAGNLYRVSPILLFECLASMAFMALDILIADVNIYLKSRRVTCRLHQWRRQFSSIHYFIDTLNMFFGQMMLFFFVHEFVTLVLYLFRIISEVQANPTSSYNVIAVLRILKYFFYFIIVTTVSEKIPQRVEILISRLSGLSYHSKGMPSQVNYFIAELQLNQPKISVMGFFNIGVNLFAPLIGTTVTYLLIFLQFQSSES